MRRIIADAPSASQPAPELIYLYLPTLPYHRNGEASPEQLVLSPRPTDRPPPCNNNADHRQVTRSFPSVDLDAGEGIKWRASMQLRLLSITRLKADRPTVAKNWRRGTRAAGGDPTHTVQSRTLPAPGHGCPQYLTLSMQPSVRAGLAFVCEIFRKFSLATYLTLGLPTIWYLTLYTMVPSTSNKTQGVPYSQDVVRDRGDVGDVHGAGK